MSHATSTRDTASHKRVRDVGVWDQEGRAVVLDEDRVETIVPDLVMYSWGLERPFRETWVRGKETRKDGDCFVLCC